VGEEGGKGRRREADSVTNHLLNAALTYAAIGLPVLPLHSPRGAGCTCSRGADCSSPAKHPRTKHGVKDATTDETTIRAWWDRWPYANVGIATGGPLRTVVLDVDPKDGGNESLAALEEKRGKIPETVRAWTGSGGQHIYFQGPANPTNGTIRNKAGLDGYPGLDLRSDGGYVVAPPSRHVSGRTYSWWKKETALIDLPTALLDVFLTPVAARREPPKARTTAPMNGGTQYALAALQRETAAIRAAGDGTRNDVLNRAAFNIGQLMAGGEIEEGVAVEELSTAASDVGLSHIEITKTIRSGMEAGANDPRTAPDGDGPAITPPPPSTQPASTQATATDATHIIAAPHIPDIPTYTLGELMAAKPPPPEELIADRALCRNTITMLIGASNAGKTLAVMHLVEALATGASFLDRAASRPARVLWFSAEGGGSLLYDRLRHKPIDPAANPRVHISTLEEIGGQPPRLTEAGTREMLARMIRAHQADVCIIDPLIFFNLGSDEKDTAEMGQLAANLMWLRQDTGAAVIIVHHTRKPPQIKRGFNPLDPGEARGAGVLIDLSDSVFAIARKDEDYWFGFPKRRWGRYLPTLKLSLDTDTLRYVVEGEEDPQIGKRPGPTKKMLREVFEGSLPLNEWLSCAEAHRRVERHYIAERPADKIPARGTIRNWLDVATDAEILQKMGCDRNYRWMLT
jgi:hypothetical protein